MRLPLCGQSYTPRSLTQGAQECQNLFFEPTEDPNEKSKGVGALYGCPGRTSFTTHADLGGEIRGLWEGAGRLFVMGASNLCEFNSAGALVTTYPMPGGFVNGHFPVQIFSNGNQLMIVTSDEASSGGIPYGYAYVLKNNVITRCTTSAYAGNVNTYDLLGLHIVAWVPGSDPIAPGNEFNADGSWTGTVITINGVNYTIQVVVTSTYLLLVSSAGIQSASAYSHTGDSITAITGAYLDGYGIVQRPPTSGKDYGRQVNLSNFLDFSTWDGLDFARKESSPDNLQCIYVNNGQLFMFGTETYEIWQNTGGISQTGVVGFPFTRITGAIGRFGHISRWADADSDSMLFSIGNDGNGGVIAYKFEGLRPKRISTYAEEFAWGMLDLTHAIGYCERHSGHVFYVVNIGPQTWVYDDTIGLWHQRSRWNGAAFTPYATAYHCYIHEWTNVDGGYGRHVTAGPGYGQGYDANLYEQSLAIYSDNGSDIKWRRRIPAIYTTGDRNFVGKMELEMETGTVASGAAPIITRQYSDDRGHTFGTPETSNAGVHNDYSLRVWWPPDGSSGRRIYEFSGVGQYKVALVDLQVDVDLGLGVG